MVTVFAYECSGGNDSSKREGDAERVGHGRDSGDANGQCKQGRPTGIRTGTVAGANLNPSKQGKYQFQPEHREDDNSNNNNSNRGEEVGSKHSLGKQEGEAAQAGRRESSEVSEGPLLGQPARLAPKLERASLDFASCSLSSLSANPVSQEVAESQINWLQVATEGRRCQSSGCWGRAH